MPRPREDSSPRPARGHKVLRGIAFSIAVVLGAVAVWLIVTGTTQKRIEIGVLAGLWGLLLASYSVFGTRHPHRVVIHHEPAPGQELDLRALGPVETREAAAARRAQEYRLEELLRRQIQAAMAAEVAALRAEVASLRSDLVEKVGGELRLERIETTRLIGSNLEALQDQVRQVAATREPAAAGGYSTPTVSSVIDATPADDVEDAVEVAVELLSGPLPRLTDLAPPVAAEPVARAAPPATAAAAPPVPAASVPTAPPAPSPWGTRSPFEPAPVSWASDRLPYVPPPPPAAPAASPPPVAPATHVAPVAPAAPPPRPYSALSGPLPYVPPPREHTALSGPMPFIPPMPPASAPAPPPPAAPPAAFVPAAAPPTPAAPPAAPAPVQPPARPRSADPFADMPRLTRFTDVEPDPVPSRAQAPAPPTVPTATPVPAAAPARPAPAAPDYAGRRRHDADAVPGLSATWVNGAGPIAGTALNGNAVNGSPANGNPSNGRPDAGAGTTPPPGGRRRRDEDDNNDVLARILAREGAPGH